MRSTPAMRCKLKVAMDLQNALCLFVLGLLVSTSRPETNKSEPFQGLRSLNENRWRDGSPPARYRYDQSGRPVATGKTSTTVASTTTSSRACFTGQRLAPRPAVGHR